MQQPRATPPISSHEDLFIQRYQWLMDSALRLTGRNQEEAEDLVHDVFIHFTLDRPDLERLTNLEGYFYTMLRNLHVSQIRRAARIRATIPCDSDLSLADYDFVEDGLHALEERTHDAQDELVRICQYACARRETSKAGSVLILRFFHGYYPAEIAEILRTSRTTADKWLQIARSEARAYLRDPNALAFIAKGSTPALTSVKSTQTTEDFVEQLRKAILKPEDGKCFGVEQLKKLYSTESALSINCEDLSHLVSCAVCLDELNSLLGLPLLADRYPAKTLRQDTHKKGGGSGSGGASQGCSGGSSGDDFMGRSCHRRKKVLEHRPQQLRVSVNGFILASHDVSSELNKQTVSVKGDEKIGFVEVFSEHEVRLLFANIAPPPDGPAEQSKRVELSEGRELELIVDFAESWPAVHVIYRDPTFAVAMSEVQSPKSETRSPTSAEIQSTKVEANVKNSKSKVQRPDVGGWTFDFGLFLRPATATAMVAALLILSLFVWLRHSVAPASATDLLARASSAEEVLANGDQVIHRTINFEEKKITGEMIARRKIEVWMSAAKGISARRLYDDKGALIAGDWRRADGVQTLYSHNSRPQIKLVPDQNVAASLNFNNAWQLWFSAKEFSSLVGPSEKVRVEERPAQYLISYQNGCQVTDAECRGLVSATLTLDRSDLHANEITFVVAADDSDPQSPNRQSATGNPHLRKYTMMEASFERRPLSTVAPAVFEPDAVLLGSDTETGRPGDTEKVAAFPRRPVPASPIIATAALEVEVLRLLNQTGADMREQVNVTRTPEGLLQVQGLTQTDKRKRELLSALSPVAENPAIKLDIQTLDEALARQSKNRGLGSITTETTQPSSNTLPIDQELRLYFAGRSVSEDQTEEAIRQFADRTLRRSLQIMKHAAAAKALVERFSPEELRTMDPEAKAKWLLLIKQHSQAVQQQTAILRRELAPMFPAVASQNVGQLGEIQSVADLVRAAQQLFGICSENDRSIRLAFSISPEASKDSAIRGAQFWRSLQNAELLAEVVNQYRAK